MGKVAVAYLAAAYAALGLGLAGGEGGEVVVEEEALATLVEHVVENLFVEFCAEGHCCESLCFTSGEHGRSVGAGDIVCFDPDGSYLGGLASVEAYALVENAAANGLFFHVVVVALYQSGLGLAFFFGKGFDIFFADSVEAVLTPVLVGAACLGDGVCAVIAAGFHVGTQLFVVYFVAVFALGGRAYSLGKLHLGSALYLDCLVGCAQRGEEFCFAYFVHLAFDHHYVVVGGADHEFHVGFFELFKGGVDYEFTVYAGHAYFGDGSVERYVAYGDGCGGCEACEAVGGVNAVGGVESYVDKSVGMVVVGEEGAKHAVYKARGEDFVVACAAFALEEASGEAAGSRELLLVFNLQWHEIDSFAGFLGRNDRGEKHSVAHAHFNRSIGLFCQLAGFDGNRTAVGQLDGFLDGIHKIIKCMFTSKFAQRYGKSAAFPNNN